MSSSVRLTLTMVEAAHLTDLIDQFSELLTETIDDDGLGDPAIARLVPDAYRGDPEAAAEFRRLTQSDLLDRRRDDAALMLVTLQRHGAALRPGDLRDADAAVELDIHLDEGAVAAWLRTLTAVRLVMAVRLGIVDEESDDLDDPRFGVYHWLGYRLDGLLRAIDD